MKSLNPLNNPVTDKQVVQGQAIATALYEQQMQREKNMAKAVRRKNTMLERAAEKALFK